MAENQLLRHQLQRWQNAGLQVAEREAKVAELIQSAKSKGHQLDAAEVEKEGGGTLSLLSAGVKTYVFNSGKEQLDTRTNAYRMLLIVLFVNAVAFVGWSLNHSAKSKTRFGVAEKRAPDLCVEELCEDAEGPAPGPAPGAARAPGREAVPGAAQATGGCCAVVELSGLEVSGLGWVLGGGPGTAGAAHDGATDVCLAVQSGDGREMRTCGVEMSEDGLLRFPERLRLPLRSRDGQGRCVFRVIDRSNALLVGRDERVARLDLPEQELLRLARTGHDDSAEGLGASSRFSLLVEARRSPLPRAASASAAARVTPELALRVREEALPNAEPSPGSLRKASEARRRPYPYQTRQPVERRVAGASAAALKQVIC